MIKIICAAIMQDGIMYTGRRHHNVIADIHTKTVRRPVDGEQGFMTSTGYFVDRETAAEIAFNAGQINKRVRMLFSEDLY